MPLLNIIVPAFPDVPNVPGVPAVVQGVGAAAALLKSGTGGLPAGLSSALTPSNVISLIPGASSVTAALSQATNALNGGLASIPGISDLGGLLGADGPGLPGDQPAAVWGIFDSSGQPVVTPDSFLSIEFRNEVRISDYPQEAGAFSSYNQVQMPYDARIRMVKSGTQGDRTLFLNSISDATISTDLFTVVTPEITYENAALVHYDYRREQKNGAGQIIVDIWLEEVRQSATAQYTQTQQPDGADPVQQGPVQASAPATGINIPTTPAAGVAAIQAAGGPNLAAVSSAFTPAQISQNVSSLFSPNAFH
jgi:hypothetical protein